MDKEAEPMTLGLVAGLGVGAGIFYYRSLVNAHLAAGLTPRIAMVHADVRKVLSLANARQTQELAEYLAGLLRQLADAGAEVATVPAFAPQVCCQELAAIAPLPLIGLVETIVSEVERRRLRRVAILGARVTMETGLFGQLAGVTELVALRPEEIEQVSAIYSKIVANERATIEERETLSSLAHKLIERDGAEAILLAGTDLAFVFGPDDTDFPHVDGARIHIEAILRSITGQAQHP